MPEEIHPVAIGKLQVGDDQVRRLFLLLFIGLKTTADGQDRDFKFLQGDDEGPPDDGIVLHDHNFFKP